MAKEYVFGIWENVQSWWDRRLYFGKIMWRKNKLNKCCFDWSLRLILLSVLISIICEWITHSHYFFSPSQLLETVFKVVIILLATLISLVDSISILYFYPYDRYRQRKHSTVYNFYCALFLFKLLRCFPLLSVSRVEMFFTIVYKIV